MRSLQSVLILAFLLLVNYEGATSQNNDTVWKGFSVSCINEDNEEVANASISCHGIRLVRKIVQKLLEEAKKKKNLEILNGISLIEKDEDERSIRNGRILKESGQIASVLSFLGNRELIIKLPSLLPSNFEAAIESSLPSSDQVKGRAKDKKEDNGVTMMAIMMGKTMAAIGFGALALLVMKALMVSALALMLSLIIAVKKLHHDGHHVVYAQEVNSHRRRRRSIGTKRDHFKNQPYRGYIGLPAEIQKLRL